MSFAIGFARFREVQVKIDTIPKPFGLGSRGPLKRLGCPAAVRRLSGFCPALVRDRFRTILIELRS
jgi:hypothetical protein